MMSVTGSGAPREGTGGAASRWKAAKSRAAVRRSTISDLEPRSCSEEDTDGAVGGESSEEAEAASSSAGAGGGTATALEAGRFGAGLGAPRLPGARGAPSSASGRGEPGPCLGHGPARARQHSPQ